MSHTILDFSNNIIKYNDKEIIVIIDDNNQPWFSAVDVADILGYTNIRSSIAKIADKIDRTSFDKLKKFMKIIPKNAQPHAIYINESGLYSLILSSRKKLAKEFRHWITSEVLPSIRKIVSYSTEQDLRNKLTETNRKLKEKKRTIRILRHNQKKIRFDKHDVLYIMRPINPNDKSKLKLEKTSDLEKRLSIYNITVPDDVEIKFVFATDDINKVESCVKLLMHKYIYRSHKKEYFECSIKKLKKMIEVCDNLIHDETYYDNCNNRSKNASNDNCAFVQNNRCLIMDQLDASDIDEDEVLYMNFVEINDQLGGSNNDDLLSEIHIDNPIVFERYCELKLYPYIDRNNKIFYECAINNIGNVLSDCLQSVDNKIIDDIMQKHNLKLDDVILFDVSSDQKNDIPPMDSDEFGKKIVVMEGGGMILPNGVIVYPNGKVISPTDKITKEQHLFQQGGSNKPTKPIDQHLKKIQNSDTYKWLNDL